MSDRRLRLVVLVLAVCVLAFQMAYKERPDKEQVERLSNFIAKGAFWKGRYPPEFSVTTLDGQTVALADEIGRKAIVLNFFATWCEPCVEEMPELNRYYAAHRGEGFLLVGIEADGKPEEVREFVARHRLAFPVVADSEGALKKLYGVESFPTTVFIGADGKVALYEMGKVANADVTFAELLGRSREALATGQGITRDAFRERLKAQPPLPPAAESERKSDEVVLEGRALAIARQMSCVCGCEHTLLACECSTGTKMRKDLKALAADDPRSDAEIIKEIDRKHCVGGKP